MTSRKLGRMRTRINDKGKKGKVEKKKRKGGTKRVG